MIKALLLSRYSRLGASSRLRFYQYLPFLKQQGFDVTVAPLLGDDYLRGLYSRKRRSDYDIVRNYLNRLRWLLKSSQFDLLWIEGELFPWMFAWGESLLNFHGIPYVVDYDDALFHRYDLHRHPMVRLSLGSKIDRVMRSATLVIAGNEYLADQARRAGARHVEYLPTVVDLNHYEINTELQHDVFTIGWIGSPSTSEYLQLVKVPLSEICRDGKARLLLIGAGPIEMQGIPIENRAWGEDSEVADIMSIDVGIMPLPDDPWERGKCGYKLIQYMACGKPVVASPVGVNRKIVDEGINGFLAGDDKEWVRALRTLRHDKELRQRMGAAGRHKVETEYSISVTAPRLLHLLKSAVMDSE